MTLLQKYWICLLTCFLMLNSSTKSQEIETKGAPLNIKASYNLGFMMAHRTRMKHIPKELSNGFEISIEKQSTNTKKWEKLYNNPTVGVAFLAASTGNQEIMGTAFGLNGYLMIPIIKSRFFNLQTSLGWGLGYITKKFDPITNYENNTIGSHLNLFAAIKLMAEGYITPQLAVTLGASFHHWSNSAFKYPNLGLNLPSANLGIIYKFRAEETYSRLNKEERKALRIAEKNEFSIIPSVGFKAFNIHDNSSYTAYTLEFNYSRIWSAKYKLSAGLDLFYNTAYQREIELSVDPSVKNNTAFQTGLNVLYHQVIGEFSILIGMGAYVFDQTLQNETFYHRFGTRYAIKDKIILSAVLHTHWARADHFKLGVGYRFRK